MYKLGYLGLGIMGSGMSMNLMRGGQTVYGYDPVPEMRRAFAESGGKALERAEDLYRTCDIIFMCLPTDDIVRKTITEIMKTARPGTIVVDMGASSPYLIRELHTAAKEKDIRLLDAPVSGGETGADDGTLVIMCGGEKVIFDMVKPYLEMMGKTVTYMGPSGAGSTAKVVNNMIVGINLCAVGEAYAFAKKAGLNPGTLFEAIRGGSAQSFVMDMKVPKILKRDFSASARIAVHLKDMNHAAETAQRLGVAIPLSNIVKAEMDWMNAHGMIDEDQCALVKYYEDAMGVVVE